MSILTRVRRLFVASPEMRECRRCGTTLGPDSDVCDNCGAEDVASYRIE
ncbi:hypothetical protein [Natronomonas marina]|jgi:uncharacterized OB-fold protein|nr:hypothetical protein [Natronomonas marina]